MAEEDAFTSKNAVNVAAGFNDSKLKGKSVIVTGGASGLGEEMVRQFVAAGAFVTIGDLSTAKAAALVDELGPKTCTHHTTNTTDFSSQVCLFKHALADAPSATIDIVCANAGCGGPDTVWQPDDPSADPSAPDLKMLNVNLTGVIYTAKLAMHYLPQNGPERDRSLVLTASLAGYLDMPEGPLYNSSKWGVRGLLHSLRRTAPRFGVRVDMIAPSYVKTPILGLEEQEALTARGMPWATAEDAARAVLHLCCDETINGRSLAVVPRVLAEEGYRDLCKDDFNEDDPLTELQNAS